jgi:hypothetical protein
MIKIDQFFSCCCQSHINDCLRLKTVFYNFIGYLHSVYEFQHNLDVFDFPQYIQFFEINSNYFLDKIQEMRSIEIEFDNFLSKNYKITQVFPYDYSICYNPTGYALNISDLFNRIEENSSLDLKESEFQTLIKEDLTNISEEINSIIDLRKIIQNKIKEMKICYLCNNSNIGLFICIECKKVVCDKHILEEYCTECAVRILKEKKQKM